MSITDSIADLMNQKREIIAYFSMEIALEPAIPTYSGGLGILAGDTVRSAADLRVPMVAVTLVHHKGYFQQHLDQNGWQTESPAPWKAQEYCRALAARVSVNADGRTVWLRAWEYTVTGFSGFTVPVLLLDADLPENSEADRSLTDFLYGGDSDYRLRQEVALGIGGVRMLRALGFHEIRRFHMNEGHPALLGLELLDERAAWFRRRQFNHEDVQAIQRRCIFTTHTPVPAGHDRFPLDQAGRILQRSEIFEMQEVFCCGGELNMTYLALNVSRYVNGVAKKHGEVSRQVLQPHDAQHHYQIDHITNGIHLATWVAPSFAELFDTYVAGWREDNASLRSALAIPGRELWRAHVVAKQNLMEEINRRTHAEFDPGTFTLGFARRVTSYKRPNFLLNDVARLKRIAATVSGLQIVYAGKAHPRDHPGKQLIQQILATQAMLLPEIKLVYLEDYDWELARLMVSGVDLWINTPQPPLEASGTSGMKASLNGVPSLSILDGWWIEGCIEDVTGWAIGNHSDVVSLYDKLEQLVLPRFQDREAFVRIMRHAIALNASHFNTQRMVGEYIVKAYSF